MTIKKTFRKLIRILSYLLLFLFLISVILSIPGVQTRLAKKLTNVLNEDFSTNIVIKKVDLSFLGSVSLRGVEIRDHHQDTLIFVNKLSTSLLNVKKIIDSDVNLGSVTMSDAHFYMKTYKDEKEDNLSVFINSFDSDTPKDSLSPNFVLSSKNLYLTNFTYKLINENDKNPLSFAGYNVGGSLSDFKIDGPNVYTKIRGLYLTDPRNIQVTSLTTDFTYTTSNMLFEKTVLKTKTSTVYADIKFDYDREDLQYFNDKVQITANIKDTRISLQDLHKLYGELDGSDVLHLDTNLTGTLNDFTVNQLKVKSDEGIKISSNLRFENVLNPEKDFSFKGDLEEVTANYQQLKSVLPNLLGKTLPSELSKLGTFTLKGKTSINANNLDVDITVKSKIGTTVANLALTNISNIDNANYKGKVALINFDIGKFFNEPLFGKVTLNGDVNGTGFTVNNINTGIIGAIEKIQFNDYEYQNLYVDGLFQNRLFNGNLKVDDEFLKMRFNGLADFSSSVNKFDFTANIEEANLLQTNLFTRDSISLIKGNITIDIVGNTFDDILGKTSFTDVVYTNQKQAYNFNNFVVVSTIKEDIKTINVVSDDIVRGYLKGDFSFNQLLPMTKNALGSMYSNYKPFKVAKNQFIEFDFYIYNQIVDVFLPQVFIDRNTTVRGRIDSKTNGIVFTLISPKVIAYDNEIESLSLRINNKNPFNTHLTADKFSSKYYNASKLNLINRTQNDTLFFKSEFKSASGIEDVFNMDFYYTFNEEKKFVLGVEKSTFDFKNNIWKINPKDNKENKVVFDFEKNEFIFSPFQLTSENQEVTFKGVVKDSTHKDLKINFQKVRLSSFLPEIDSLSMYGVLSGDLDFLQNEGVYSPKGNLSIADFKINNFKQGDLDLNIKGDNSYEKYAVDLTLTNLNRESIFANGNVDFTKERPILDLDVKLDKFQLNAFSPLGQDILTRIRGEASGSFNVSGFLGNPDLKGELTLKDAGLKFPYLNVDYNFDGLTKIRLQEQSFIFDKLTLMDVKYQSVGDFSGSISHLNFKDWYLDFKIQTDNLLVLDTKETEESIYYGTAFINGDARIFGLTNSLTINVNAKTNPNTVFVLPLSDLKTVDNYSLIRFDVKEKIKIDNKNQFELKTLKGLTLNIDLEVTKDATAEVVIDTKSGSSLKGNGNGNLQIQIDTRGGFIMEGDFIVDKGKYDFKYGGIVNKTFQVEKGGSISWNGNPLDAILNVTAIYMTKANPAQLLENFNTNRKIPVKLITKISGGLFTSQQEFDIEIPNVNSTIKSELEFKLNDNDVNEKTKQFLSLLVTNSFFNPDNASFNSSSAIIGTTSNAISGFLSDLISSDDGKVQVGVGYEAANKSNVDNLNTDDLVNLSVGTQISDRIIINGKVGVPVGSKTQSSVVGEVKIEVLLNDNGNFRGVIFNRQNEIQYSTEEEGYTQGVGLTYQVNFNNLSELLQKLGLKKKKTTEIEKDTVIKAASSSLIRFNDTIKKKNGK